MSVEIYNEAIKLAKDCVRFIKSNQRLIEEIDFLLKKEKKENVIEQLNKDKNKLLEDIGIMFKQKKEVELIAESIKIKTYTDFII